MRAIHRTAGGREELIAARHPAEAVRWVKLSRIPHTHAHGHSHTGHSHSHSHAGHGHDHGHGSSVSRLRIALAITAVILVAEAVGGYLANSLALFADAGHMLTDVAAALGLVTNAISAWVLHPGGEDDLNIRGAYLHILGDLLGFVGTIAAALLIRRFGWLAADPIASIIVSALILRGAWTLVRDSTDVLLESTPAHISAASVRDQLTAIPGIESVHDLHLWTVTSNVIARSVHAIVREPERHQHVLEHVLDAMRLFGIQHVTVQLERKEMYERELHLHT